MVSTGSANPLGMARVRLSALEGAPSSPTLLFWGCDLSLVEGSERLILQDLDSTERGRAYVGRPRVFLGSWFTEPGTADGLSRETDLLIDSVRILLPAPASVREMADRQLRYGALQSALETETTLRLATAWDPADRIVVSTSLAMSGDLTVLAPSDVQRLPAGSAGALRKALHGGELAVVPGNVATATAWWTVARSGFVRAIVEPGAGMTSVGPKPVFATRGGHTGGGAGGKPSDSGKKGEPATEYLAVVNQTAKKTAETAAQLANRGISGFDSVNKAITPKIAGLF
jgi:hypothetical protein